jgi:hypothetical protein
MSARAFCRAPACPVRARRPCDGWASKFDPKGHERPYQKAVLIDLIDGYARPGDQIEVPLGDRAQGGPGTRALTFVEDSFKLRAYVDVTGTSRLAAWHAALGATR